MRETKHVAPIDRNGRRWSTCAHLMTDVIAANPGARICGSDPRSQSLYVFTPSLVDNSQSEIYAWAQPSFIGATASHGTRIRGLRIRLNAPLTHIRLGANLIYIDMAACGKCDVEACRNNVGRGRTAKYPLRTPLPHSSPHTRPLYNIGLHT
jgi:hypothetical protein